MLGKEIQWEQGLCRKWEVKVAKGQYRGCHVWRQYDRVAHERVKEVLNIPIRSVTWKNIVDGISNDTLS